MQKCKNCGNEIRNKGVYCDQCGMHLNLIKEEIKYIPNKVDDLNNLEKIIVDSLKHITNHYIEFDYYIESIYAYLLECTNISVILQKNGISLKNFNIYGILISINENDTDESILDTFLHEINLEYKSKKSIEKRLQNVILYTNIDVKWAKNELFIDILSLFNLQVFEFSDFNFDDGWNLSIEEQNFFNHDCLMFKFSSVELDEDILKEKALNEIRSFFGYLTYCINFKKIMYKYSNNELMLKHRLIDFKCTVMLTLNSENEIFMPNLISETINETKRISKSNNMNNLKKCNFINFNMDDKKNITQKIKEYFALYYIASYEDILENSFMSFYSLSEKIIKDFANKIPDKKLIYYMIKIWKINNFPHHIGQRITLIRLKRNNFVHENVRDEINTLDRIVMKIIAEGLINFLIDNLKYVNNFSEYKILLDYSTQDKVQKERLIDLINLSLELND